MEHPRTGGRIRLERQEVDAERARYRVTLFSPEARWSATATVGLADGALELGSFEGEGEGEGGPPGWLVDGARAHLGTLWRRSAEQGWPRRILRWRRAR